MNRMIVTYGCVFIKWSNRISYFLYLSWLYKTARVVWQPSWNTLAGIELAGCGTPCYIWLTLSCSQAADFGAIRRGLEMGIEPNNVGSGSVRFGRCYSSGSVRVLLMRVSQLRIWFGHSCNCMKLGTLEKYNTCKFLIKKHQTNHTDSATRQW